MQFDKGSIFDAFIYACIAILGGLSREITNESKRHTFRSFITRSIVSIFSGILIFCICKNFNVNEWLTATSVGLSGYLGVELIKLLASIFKNKLRGEVKEE